MVTAIALLIVCSLLKFIHIDRLSNTASFATTESLLKELLVFCDGEKKNEEKVTFELIII